MAEKIGDLFNCKMFVLLAAICLLLTVNAEAIDVPGGDFETPALSYGGWAYVNQINSAWTVTVYGGTPWIGNNYSGGGLYPGVGHSGVQWVDMNGSYIHQPLGATYTEGATYELSAWVTTPSSGERLIGYFTRGGSDGWTGATKLYSETQTVPNSSNHIWNKLTYSYTATGADDGKQIGICLFGDYNTYVDDVTFEATNVEPTVSGKWYFRPDSIEGTTVLDKTANGNDGTIHGSIDMAQMPDALILDGVSDYVTVESGPLPTKEITLKGWVKVSSPVEWAGVVGYIQDNGSVEHGWILGQKGGAYMFGLSTGTLTYLSAESPLATDKWSFVVGTYDGSEMKIYVNGVLAGSSAAQSGDISYQASEFRIGSYKDSNEEYLWAGEIAEVAVFDRVVSVDEINEEFSEKKEYYGYYDVSEIAEGPYVYFYNENEVTVYWKTVEPVKSTVEYGVSSQLGKSVSDTVATTDHSLKITDITPGTDYSYRIITEGVPSETFTFHSTFDPGPGKFPAGVNPYPVDSLTPIYAAAAEYIVNASGVDKGVCIDYGCGTGRLAYEIAKRTNLKIIGYEADPEKIAQAREYLDRAGIYGTRVSVIRTTTAELKCRDYTANLVVSDKMIATGSCPGTSAEVFRILRPDGGMAVLGQPVNTEPALGKATLEAWLEGQDSSISETDGLWAVMSRGVLAGAGKWTHYYADTANTANSGESGINTNLQVLWYGNPGPRYIVDRHNRPMCSLYNKGIIVTPGVDRLMAYDAYNGSRYWDVSLPDSARVAIFRDTGWVALSDDHVYAAHKRNCVGLDLKTGEPKIFLNAPQLTAGKKRHWGYLAIDGGEIFGSGQKEGASLIGHSRAHVDQAYFDNIPISTSEYLFSMDRLTGELNWQYKHSGGSAIVNPTIVVAGDYMYFIESRNTIAVNDSDGRVKASTLMSGSSEYLVKLNKHTGALVLAEQIDLPFQHVAYLSYAAQDDMLVATGSRNSSGYRYEHRGYKASDLSLAWSSYYQKGGSNGSHGEQDQHPVVIGGTMYSKYYKFDASSGNVSSFSPGTGGCGAISGTASYIFARNGNPCMYQLPTGSASKLTSETRVGCWVNMFGAGGLVVVPESGSGCTCDFQLQTSMTFMPK